VPDCLLINYRNLDEAASLTRLRPEFLSEFPLVVTRERIAELFSMEQHPLMQTRSDVTVSAKGDFSNVGQPREVIFVTMLGETASVAFPASLEGKVWKSGAEVRLEFPNPAKALSLSFSNESLNLRFGGTLRKIDTSAESGILSMPNGCIQVPFDESLLENSVSRALGTAVLVGADYLAGAIGSFASSDFGGDYFCNPPHPACEEFIDH